MGEGKRTKQVEAIAHGTVVDHIPSHVTLQVARLLAQPDDQVFIGVNLRSAKMPTKGVIKIAERELSPNIISRLYVLAPQATMSIIRDYQVVQKGAIPRPQVMVGVLNCPNPNCVTNHEPCQTCFTVTGDEAQPDFHCAYCERDFSAADLASAGL